jgi:pimeloyl-ACP methyl ester carboxylesterase
VLVLTGVGLTAAVACRWIAYIEEHFAVIAPPGGLATPAGALALLDAAGVEEAHILGLSFGATIALQIALDHPERVRTLVLASATAGGDRYAAPEPPVRHFLSRLADLPAEEGVWGSVPYLYAVTTKRRNAPRIGEDIAHRLRQPLDPRSYRDQLAVARAHDAGARLTEVGAPTLVVHGEEDRILPLENGRRLADGIAAARFMPVPGGAHAFPTDVPGSTRELVSFLLAHSRKRQRAGSAARRTGRATRA